MGAGVPTAPARTVVLTLDVSEVSAELEARRVTAGANRDVSLANLRARRVDFRRDLDRQIAESTGVLGALRDGAELEGVFGSGALSTDVVSGIGGLIGPQYSTRYSGGLGSRGSGLGGGNAEALGGLGTRGRGGGSGYGTGGGNFGAIEDASLKLGTPWVDGAIEPEQVEKVVKQHANQLRYCHARVLKSNPELEGKIVVKAVVAPDGSVSSATVVSSTMNNDAVESCVVGRFMRFEFPEPSDDGIVILNYPMIFELP